MKMWAVKFEDQQTGEQQYREYPVIANLRERTGLCRMLQNRQFLTDYIVLEITQYDPEISKRELAELFGQLIYSN